MCVCVRRCVCSGGGGPRLNMYVHFPPLGPERNGHDQMWDVGGGRMERSERRRSENGSRRDPWGAVAGAERGTEHFHKTDETAINCQTNKPVHFSNPGRRHRVGRVQNSRKVSELNCSTKTAFPPYVFF